MLLEKNSKGNKRHADVGNVPYVLIFYSAGQDYSQTNQLLIFNETVQNVPVTVQIINDGYFKEPEYFIGRLSLQFPSDYQQFIHITPSITTALIVDDGNIGVADDFYKLLVAFGISIKCM